jgi:hypothetical protein
LKWPSLIAKKKSKFGRIDSWQETSPKKMEFWMIKNCLAFFRVTMTKQTILGIKRMPFNSLRVRFSLFLGKKTIFPDQ